MSDSANPTVVPAQQELDKRVKAFAEAIDCEQDLVRKQLSEVVDLERPDQALSIFDDEECLTFGDLAKHFVQAGHCRVAVLRLAMKHLRGQTDLKKFNGQTTDGVTDLAKAVKDMANANRPIDAWSDRELLEHYDEENPKVWKELSDRAHGRHCIVYTDSSETDLHMDSSLELLKLARKQQTPEKWRIAGRLRPVRRPGTFLARTLEESPFYPRIALVNGYCPQSDTDWNGVDEKTRILVRLHVHNIEKTQLSKREMKRIYKDAHGLSSFADEYSEAALLYDELEAQDNLPKLKVSPQDVRQEPYSGKVDTGF